MSAFPALFCASHPAMYGGTNYLSPTRTTLAEVLSAHGYSTYGVTSNPYLTKTYGYDRGFKSFINLASRAEAKEKRTAGLKRWLPENDAVRSLLRRLAAELRRSAAASEAYPTVEMVNQAILTQLTDRTSAPVFAWAHYMDLHYPYVQRHYASVLKKTGTSQRKLARILASSLNAPAAMTSDEITLHRQIYDASMDALDLGLFRLIEQLKKTIDWDNTLLIVTADHGEELYEEGRYGHAFSGGLQVFNESLLHIPLLIKWPGGRPARLPEDRELLSQIDIPASIAALCSAPWPDDWCGNNFLANAESSYTDRHPGDFHIAQRCQDTELMVGVIAGNQCLRLCPENKETKAELISLDGGYAEQPPRDRLDSDLKLFWQSHFHENQIAYSFDRQRIVGIDPKLRAHLQALGYDDPHAP